MQSTEIVSEFVVVDLATERHQLTSELAIHVLANSSFAVLSAALIQIGQSNNDYLRA
jgi:hypothetical protein